MGIGFGKHRLIIIIMFLVSTNIMAQDIRTEVVINGNISFLDNIIEKEQIGYFTKYDLRILRNTIFAKYGYQFNSMELQNHFSKFIWYNGNKSNVQNKLTNTDWINVELIQTLEKEDIYDEDNYRYTVMPAGSLLNSHFSEVTGFSEFNEQYRYLVNDYESIMIRDYKGERKVVMIPPRLQNVPVTALASDPFSNNRLSRQIKSVIIPDSIISIGPDAFRSCRLTSVTIPNGVIFICCRAFENNPLENIVIPDTVIFIDYGAFICSQLSTITIGDNVLLATIFPVFVNGFDNFYKENGSKAGTYIFNNGIWNKQ